MTSLKEEQDKLAQSEKIKIHAETARTCWKDIALFYAKGQMIHVSEKLDLIEVAHCLSIDDTAQIEKWIEESLIQRAFDELAGTWAESGEDLWAVVVKPWVLVQAVNNTVN